MKLLMTLICSLAFALFANATDSNTDCKSKSIYYFVEYIDMLTEFDSTIQEIHVMKGRFSASINTSVFDVKEIVYLDYHQLDQLYAYVNNKSSNVFSTNNTEIEMANLWLVYGYKDVNNQLNALVKVVHVEELLLKMLGINDDNNQHNPSEEVEIDADGFMKYSDFFLDNFPKQYLQPGIWKQNDSVSQYFLVTNIGYGCTPSTVIKESTKGNAKFKLPSITFLSEPSIGFGDAFTRGSIISDYYLDESIVARLIKDYCFIDTRRSYYQPSAQDLTQLERRVSEYLPKKTLKQIQKMNLLGLARKDRYGRVDVILYDESKPVETTHYKATGRRFRIEDIYNTKPNCKVKK